MARILPRQILPVAGILVLGIAGFITATVRKGDFVPQEQQEPSTQAVRRGGLREAARIKKHYVSTQNTGGWIKYDLESLTKNSFAIVIGTPLVSSSDITTNGELITTEYEVKLREILKGDLKENQVVRVSVPGGKITFEDGTSAEIKTPDLVPMEKGNTYVLFLRTTEDTPEVFGLTGGGQGLFELSSTESVVKPHGHHIDSVQKHKDEPITDFIEEIKAAVRKYPESTPCCN
jgi:hypothetical protein